MVMPWVTSYFSLHVDYATGYIETRFSDGKTCVGSPDQRDAAKNAQYARQAVAAGYGDDVRRMAIENDLLHSFLALRAGMDYSPTLRGVATGRFFPLWRYEENTVLALQYLLHDREPPDEDARTQIDNYVHEVRPGTTRALLVAEAREWLDDVKRRTQKRASD